MIVCGAICPCWNTKADSNQDAYIVSLVGQDALDNNNYPDD